MKMMYLLLSLSAGVFIIKQSTKPVYNEEKVLEKSIVKKEAIIENKNERTIATVLTKKDTLAFSTSDDIDSPKKVENRKQKTRYEEPKEDLDEGDIVVFKTKKIKEEKQEQKEIHSLIPFNKKEEKVLPTEDIIVTGGFVNSEDVSVNVEDESSEEDVSNSESSDEVDSEVDSEDIVEEEKEVEIVDEEPIVSEVELADSENLDFENELNWTVYDNTPEGATVTPYYDEELENTVVQSSGDGTKNGYKFSFNGESLGLRDSFILGWDLKFDSTESFVVLLEL